MTKKISLIVLTVLLTLSISFTAFADDSSQARTTPFEILVLGDSISTGYNLENYKVDASKTASYANLLAKKYSADNMYVNMAFDGQTSSQLASNLNRGIYDDYIKKSDIIAISIGGNDMLNMLSQAVVEALGLNRNATFADIKNIDFTNTQVYKNLVSYITSNKLSVLSKQTITDFQKNFQSISQYIYSKNPNAYVVFQTIYNPFSGAKDLEIVSNLAELIIPRMNKVISSNSTIKIDGKTQKIYDYVDVYSEFHAKAGDYTNINSLDIHPNKDGHKLIFQLCDKAVAKRFNLSTSALLTTPDTTVKSPSAQTDKLIDKAVGSVSGVTGKVQRMFIYMICIGSFGLAIYVVYVYKTKNKTKK